MNISVNFSLKSDISMTVKPGRDVMIAYTESSKDPFTGKGNTFKEICLRVHYYSVCSKCLPFCSVTLTMFSQGICSGGAKFLSFLPIPTPTPAPSNCACMIARQCSFSLVFWENTLFFILPPIERSRGRRSHDRVVLLLVYDSLLQLSKTYVKLSIPFIFRSMYSIY